MLRIRRLWLAPAFLISFFIYFLFIYSATDQPYTSETPIGLEHLVKRPSANPVRKWIPMPKGNTQRLPPIQYDFKMLPEMAEAKSTRESRQNAVKEAFIHSWEGYKKHAWGQDEVGPVSGSSRSSFGGWGATLVDAMDTLWIMGLEDEFEQCVEFVKTINFYQNTEEQLNIFETTIRYLGGLLAAYDLSGGKHEILLAKAVELADILYLSFDTPKRMPVVRWSWKLAAAGHRLEPSETTLLAEFGSLTLEFTRMTQLVRNPKYFDAVQRIMKEMRNAQKSTKLPGLWPTIVNAKDITFTSNHFTLGGMADSTYEYLPKMHLLLYGANSQYQQMYETAIEAAKKYLFFRPMIPTGQDVLYTGNSGVSLPGQTSLEPQGQHLTCFLGGLVGMGAKIFRRKDDLDIARRLVDGCIWAYDATPSGLMPETFHLVPCHTGVGEAEAGACDWSEDKWYEAVAKRNQKKPGDQNMTSIEYGKSLVEKGNIIPGFTAHGDSRYILRPEAIESIFILYRITGDRKYQDIAWKMFTSIDEATRTDIAHAALFDVRNSKPSKSDRMESFWLAETLKYFYLIFSEPSLISLDEWVLNTEAHPFKTPGRMRRTADMG